MNGVITPILHSLTCVEISETHKSQRAMKRAAGKRGRKRSKSPSARIGETIRNNNENLSLTTSFNISTSTTPSPVVNVTVQSSLIRNASNASNSNETEKKRNARVRSGILKLFDDLDSDGSDSDDGNHDSSDASGGHPEQDSKLDQTDRLLMETPRLFPFIDDRRHHEVSSPPMLASNDKKPPPASPLPSSDALTTQPPASPQLLLEKLDVLIHFILTFIQQIAYFWFDESGAGPVSRFLRHDDTTVLAGTFPTYRMLIFMSLGFVITAGALWLTEDEYIQGPRLFQSSAAQHSPRVINETEFPIHIAFQNLGCYIDNQPIIRNVTGDIRPGRITGILGQSGSGKTTFAMALMGRGRRNCRPATGQVFLNGQERSLESFIDRVGFVPQDDVLYPELSVEETLRFSGNWRLPRHLSEKDKTELYEDVISVLGLERVRNSRVGSVANPSLSGGERKRVSIGVELMSLPSVLILDEPTSGLDSAAAYQLLLVLQKIAKRKVSVVAVLHQPSSRIFSLLDDVILMQKGRAAYVGPRESAEPYFTSLGFENQFQVKDNQPRSPSNESKESLPQAEFLLDILADLVPTKCHSAMGTCTSPSSLGDAWENSSLMQSQNIRVQEDMQKWKNESHRLMIHDGESTGAQFEMLSSLAECDGHSYHFVRNICLVFYGARNVHRQPFRPKPGVIVQSLLWFELLVVLAFRRGLLVELAIVSVLAACVAFTSSYNLTWNRKPFGVFFISLAVALPGLTGAVLEDDILPVRRAINSGMLIGAYEFAIIVFSFVKGWVFAQVFSFNYHLYLYQEGRKEEEDKERKFCVSPFNIMTYYEFTHLVHMNYLAARGIGNLVVVLADHRNVLAFVIATTILVASHVNCYFSPNRTQLERAGAYIFNGRVNFAPIITILCSFSYVRYFLEAMLLWDPDRDDKIARSFTLRYFGYRESNKLLCVTAMVALWIGGQALRFLAFVLRNSNDFNNLYDAPLFFIFAVKVVTGYLFVLLLMTIGHEWHLFKSAWAHAVEEALKKRAEQQKRFEEGYQSPRKIPDQAQQQGIASGIPLQRLADEDD